MRCAAIAVVLGCGQATTTTTVPSAGAQERRLEPEAPIAATGSADEARKALNEARAVALKSCRSMVVGPVTMTLVFGDGGVQALPGPYGDEIADCVTRAITGVRFPAMPGGTQLELPLR